MLTICGWQIINEIIMTKFKVVPKFSSKEIIPDQITWIVDAKLPSSWTQRLEKLPNRTPNRQVVFWKHSGDLWIFTATGSGLGVRWYHPKSPHIWICVEILSPVCCSKPEDVEDKSRDLRSRAIRVEGYYFIPAESLEDHRLGRRCSWDLCERERERWVTRTCGTRIPRTTALDPALGNRSLDPSTSRLFIILFQALLIAKLMSYSIHCIVFWNVSMWFKMLK